MSRTASSLYDSQITIFSPDGKLFQVEYAFRAVEATNIFVAALKSDSCAVIVAQKKLPSEAIAQDKLLDPESLSNLHHVTPKIGGAFVGLPADCRSIVYRAQQKAQDFNYTNGYDIPVSHLALKIANINQMFTQHAYMRLHACIGILIGIDEDTNKAQMYRFDPAGWYTGNRAASIGSKEAEARSLFERVLTENELKSVEETIFNAISVFQKTLGTELRTQDIEVALVTTDHPEFRILSAEEVENYLQRISEYN